MLVKKYPNRRLYDTVSSRYITLEELAGKVREGADVRVVDARTGEDLTPTTLMQILVEGRGAAKMFPVSLLVQLIRMGDDALAEFLGRYMTWALEMYARTRQGAAALAPFNPLVMAPFAAGSALARMFRGPSDWEPAPPPPSAAAAAPPPSSHDDDVADLRRELEEIKRRLKPLPRKR